MVLRNFLKGLVQQLDRSFVSDANCGLHKWDQPHGRLDWGRSSCDRVHHHDEQRGEGYCGAFAVSVGTWAVSGTPAALGWLCHKAT
jgi:hypothetical protein